MGEVCTLFVKMAIRDGRFLNGGEHCAFFDRLTTICKYLHAHILMAFTKIDL